MVGRERARGHVQAFWVPCGVMLLRLFSLLYVVDYYCSASSGFTGLKFCVGRLPRDPSNARLTRVFLHIFLLPAGVSTLPVSNTPPPTLNLTAAQNVTSGPLLACLLCPSPTLHHPP